MPGNYSIKLILMFNRNPHLVVSPVYKAKHFLQNLPKLETFINRSCRVTSEGG